MKALETDEVGNYTLGDETEVDWCKVYKSFFKKILGCLNAQQNGTKVTNITTEWESAFMAMGNNSKFILRRSN